MTGRISAWKNMLRLRKPEDGRLDRWIKAFPSNQSPVVGFDDGMPELRRDLAIPKPRL